MELLAPTFRPASTATPATLAVGSRVRIAPPVADQQDLWGERDCHVGIVVEVREKGWRAVVYHPDAPREPVAIIVPWGNDTAWSGWAVEVAILA